MKTSVTGVPKRMAAHFSFNTFAHPLLWRPLSFHCFIRFSFLYKTVGLLFHRSFKIKFPKMKSEDLRKLVLSKHENGESLAQILEDLNGSVSYRTIRRWCKMVRETGAINLSHSSGRPRIIRTKAMIRKVKTRMKRKRKVSIRKARQ